MFSCSCVYFLQMLLLFVKENIYSLYNISMFCMKKLRQDTCLFSLIFYNLFFMFMNHRVNQRYTCIYNCGMIGACTRKIHGIVCVIHPVVNRCD